MTKHYNSDFYEYQKAGSLRSAETVVPILLSLTQANSVVDLGCGVGTWLSVFKKNGVAEVLGLDGEYVDRRLLEIDAKEFQPADLERAIEVGRKFDLAMSLEAAEHIAADAADNLVAALVALAPVVVFSAAIPHQRGSNHINEQWPDYWREKFAKHNYVAVDCIRGRIWTNPSVNVWYRQNIVIYVEFKALQTYPSLYTAYERDFGHPFSIVHPDYYLDRARLAFVQPGKALRLYWWDSFVEALKSVLPESSILMLKNIQRKLSK